jgi:succinate dehydrogenase/fumarate reductase flavoprotein subunit
VQVVLLEKESKLGGNSAKASSGINALTPASGDSVDLYTNDTLVSGGGRSRTELVSKLVVRVNQTPEATQHIRTVTSLVHYIA